MRCRLPDGVVARLARPGTGFPAGPGAPRAASTGSDRAQGRRAAARGRSAGDAALRQRIEQLEEQLVDMQVVVGTLESLARGATAPAASGRQVPSPAAAFGAADAGRLDGIETQIRALAAQLEQVQEQVRALAAGAGVQPQAANEPPGAAPRPADRSMPARPSRSARASDP